MDPIMQAKLMVVEQYNSTHHSGRHVPVQPRIGLGLELQEIPSHIDVDDTYVVWFAFTLGSWKALVSTKVPDDTYYEVTHRFNGDTYVDTYVKQQNTVIPADHPVHNV